MTLPYISSSTLWHHEGTKAAYKVLDDFLCENLQTLDVFSINPDRFFGFRDNTHWNFVHRLLQNDSRRAAFCEVFAALWNAHPMQELLILLIAKDFTQPGMVKLFGMEDLGFQDPEEDFGAILKGLKASIQLGFLQGDNGNGAYDGRARLHLNTVRGIVPPWTWGDRLQDLESLQTDFDEVGKIPWSSMIAGNESFILANFIFEFFANSKSSVEESFRRLSICFEVNGDYRQAIIDCAEIVDLTGHKAHRASIMGLFFANQSKEHQWEYFKQLLAFLKSPQSIAFSDLSFRG